MKINLTNPTDRNVTLRVHISGISHWDLNYSGSKNIKESKNKASSEAYELGKIKDLVDTNDNWDLILWNVTDNEITATVLFEWFIDGETAPVAVWKTDEYKHGKVKVPANSKVWVSSDADYRIL